MIKKIFRAIKNILFPRVYAPWEQPGITDLSHIGMGLAEDFSTCTPEIIAELEQMVDNRRKELHHNL